jgi:hypothetical protein
MVQSNESLYDVSCILQGTDDGMKICKATSGSAESASFAPGKVLFWFQAIKVHVRIHSLTLPLASVLRTEPLRHFYTGMP